MLWGATISFYHIEVKRENVISKIKNGTPIQVLFLLVLFPLVVM